MNNAFKKKVSDHFYQGIEMVESFKLLRDPTRIDAFLKIANLQLQRADQKDTDELAATMRWTPEAVSAVESRYRLVLPPLSELLGFPDGSLGQAFGTFLEQNGLDPEDITHPPVDDDLSYFAAHIAETHDIWHVVTGFGSELEGEGGVAAFAAAQTGLPIQYSIIAGTLIDGMRNEPTALKSRMEAIVSGWTMGKQAKPLFGVRWDALWSEPLAAVRKGLRIP